MEFKLSPSALGLMKECPRCFWLTKHNAWKRPSGIFPTLPNGMDRILKTHFDKFMEKGEMPPELCENNLCEGMKLFDDKARLEGWRNNFIGVRWRAEDGNTLFGAVDNLLMKDGKLIVLDYKTRGFPLKAETPGYSQSQMNLYNLLLRKNGYLTEDFAFLLFYVPKEVTPTGEVVFDTTLIKQSIDVKQAEELFRKAITLLNGECPQEKCAWCKNV
ncbi:PD-(D/E)XK nuclease family protein [Nanoarchaeota archaeon]